MKETYFQILKSLIQIPSPSGEEKKLADFIIENHLIKGWVVERDAMHNILFRPEDDNKTEKLPLLYAHLDTHPNGKKNKGRLPEKDIIWMDEESGEVRKKHEIQMGFDDKAGVAAILYLMKHTEHKFRALFVVQEETSTLPTKYGRSGGGGIEYAINHGLKWVFEKSDYVLSLDRANGYALIDEYGDEGDYERPRIRMCSEQFRDWIIACSTNVSHTLNVAKGRIADIYNIRSIYGNLNCVNLSVGYYDEHKSTEHLNIDETLGIIRVVIKCLEDGLSVE